MNLVSARHRLSPLGLLQVLRHNRQLLLRLVARDMQTKYQGSLGGLLWSLLLPLLMLGIYVFVFGVVFGARPAAQAVASAGAANGPSLATFGIALFCGMLLHSLLSDCLIRAPTAIITQPNYVKKIVFPLELLPLTVVGAACVQYAIGLAVLLLALLLTQGLGWSALLLPLALTPLLLVCTGVALGLSALAVYLRDIAQLTGLLSTMLMFLSPVFYPVSALPQVLQGFIYLNPLTLPIEAARAMLLSGGGAAPAPAPAVSSFADAFAHLFGAPWQAWALYCLVSVAVLVVGWVFFQGTRRGFADVI
jgi:lipopolysaccharide transport system permease protein